MLSRVADSLLWTGRFIERVENLARILGSIDRAISQLDPDTADTVSADSRPLLHSLGLPIIKKYDLSSVVEHLVFDVKNPYSIFSSIRAARENIRAVREQVTVEMWEQMNRFYLWSVSKYPRQLYSRQPRELFDTVRREALLFLAHTNSALPHTEGWDFIQIGMYLERADKTSRLLDDKYLLFGPKLEILHWNTVLVATSAVQPYRQKYSGEARAREVAELLLLDERFPRSVEYSLDRINTSLRSLSGTRSGTFSNISEKFAGQLLGYLAFSEIDDLLPRGLHRVVDSIQLTLNTIGENIHKTYIEPTVTAIAQSAATQQQQQIQQ